VAKYAYLHRQHLQEHRPKMYRQLQASGELEDYLKGVETEVKELLAGMVEQGP
jgi:Transposon-encoded protein TnpV